ncbi:MAG TPA: hypothetical protein VG797_06350 [Phycisphaerales bacterium]|nr:hypothetical protein [Phycisphaerales bacterium]
MARGRMMTVVCAALVAGAAGLACGQIKTTPADPMSGPRINDPAAGAPSLVERNFEGKLKRYEERIEEAAASKLDLTSEQRAAVQKVLDERAAKIDGVVRENFELLVKGAAARQAGDREAIRENLKQMREKFGDLPRRGLLDSIADTLPSEKADQLRSMVQQYMRASIEEEIHRRAVAAPTDKDKKADEPRKADDESKKAEESEKPDEPKKPDEAKEPAPDDMMDEPPASPPKPGAAGRADRAKLVAQFMINEFTREVRRSYERIIADGKRRLDEIAKELDLTPEQDGKIRQLAANYALESKQNPTQAQRAKFFAEIMKELTPEQRRKFIQYQRAGK